MVLLRYYKSGLIKLSVTVLTMSHGASTCCARACASVRGYKNVSSGHSFFSPCLLF